MLPGTDGYAVCRRLRVDFASYEVFIDGITVPMSLRESELLTFFLENPNRACDRLLLPDLVWGPDLLQIFAAPSMHKMAVVDRGAGIPARDLPRLTERFFRVDDARSRDLGGPGLGLAIVQRIVQLHGGRLEISSAVGQGTTVTARLPAAGAAAPQQATEA